MKSTLCLASSIFHLLYLFLCEDYHISLPHVLKANSSLANIHLNKLNRLGPLFSLSRDMFFSPSVIFCGPFPNLLQFHQHLSLICMHWMGQKFQQQPSCGNDTNFSVHFALCFCDQDIGKMRVSYFTIILNSCSAGDVPGPPASTTALPRTQLAVFVEIYFHYRNSKDTYHLLVSYLLTGLYCSVSETSFLHNWLVHLLFLLTFAADCISPGCNWRVLNEIMLKIYLCGNHLKCNHVIKSLPYILKPTSKFLTHSAS